jgi:hypothetical protein
MVKPCPAGQNSYRGTSGEVHYVYMCSMAATLLWANNPGNDSEYDEYRNQKPGSVEEHSDHDEYRELLSSQELPRTGSRLNGQAQPKGSQNDANSQTRSYPNGIFGANE